MKKHWMSLQSIDSTNLCFEAHISATATSPSTGERHGLVFPLWDPSSALGELLNDTLGIVRKGWPRGVTRAEFKNIKRQLLLAIHPDKKGDEDKKPYTAACQIVNSFLEENEHRMAVESRI